MEFIKKTESLDDLDLGSGAKQRLEAIRRLGKEKELYQVLEMVYENGEADEDEIDGFLWFELDENDTYLEIMGINREDYEAAV